MMCQDQAVTSAEPKIKLGSTDKKQKKQSSAVGLRNEQRNKHVMAPARQGQGACGQWTSATLENYVFKCNCAITPTAGWEECWRGAAEEGPHSSFCLLHPPSVEHIEHLTGKTLHWGTDGNPSMGSFFDSATRSASTIDMWVSFVLRCRWDGEKHRGRWRANSPR